jgi:hypothetical protein
MVPAILMRRAPVALLLFVVLCVPALTRAAQHLTSVPISQESSGFSRSSDAAPERVTISPDVQVTPAAPVPLVGDVPPPAWTNRPSAPPLVSSAPPIAPRALRAPPLARS